jgi:hypothetical protein
MGNLDEHGWRRWRLVLNRSDWTCYIGQRGLRGRSEILRRVALAGSSMLRAHGLDVRLFGRGICLPAIVVAGLVTDGVARGRGAVFGVKKCANSAQ